MSVDTSGTADTAGVLVRPPLAWALSAVVGIVFGWFIPLRFVPASLPAAWLGTRKWRLLHLVGGWYIWISFAVAIGKRLPQGPVYWAMMALVLGVAIVRLVAMSRRSRRARVVTA